MRVAEGNQSHRRAEQREFCTTTVGYMHWDSSGPGSMTVAGNETSGEGLSTNMSASGMGIITSHALSSGQGLMVFSKRLGEVPRRAEVRWCVPQGVDLWRVGIRLN